MNNKALAATIQLILDIEHCGGFDETAARLLVNKLAENDEMAIDGLLSIAKVMAQAHSTAVAARQLFREAVESGRTWTLKDSRGNMPTEVEPKSSGVELSFNTTEFNMDVVLMDEQQAQRFSAQHDDIAAIDCKTKIEDWNEPLRRMEVIGRGGWLILNAIADWIDKYKTKH